MIVDVREPAEFEICSIPGAILIPLQQLPQPWRADPSKEIVLQQDRSRSQRDGISAAGRISRARN
jgi:rhodanese-related sulfurtransferase